VGAPRIIIVDDDRQVSSMLRSSLKLTGQPYTIVDVPSAEEALLELTRGGADVLVTDLRLPGISGIELLEKARKAIPQIHAIVVTGHPTEEARSRAEELGVVAFLNKPIRTSHFLEAVNRALQLTDQEGQQPLEDEKAFLAEWLMTMQRELGAESTLLLDGQGEIVVQAGELHAIDLKSALPSLLTATGAALEVSRTLGDESPASLMYFDGEKHDLYLATAGADHSLAVVFPAKQGAEQIGAVLQYSRRAASDLMNALYGIAGSRVRARHSREGSGRAAEAAPAPREGVGGRESQGMEPRKKPTAKPQKPKEQPAQPPAQPDLESAAGTLADTDADEYWDEAARSGDTGPISEDTLTYDEARKRGLLPKTPEE
jgi:CheY-like chemotaxis protein/predicted regulator of Ras-like GTPase activity (Roadblock/LC7/MglB family)